MGYTEDDQMVQVDFFKESGKWYTTEAVRMDSFYSPPMPEAFKEALRKHLAKPIRGEYRLSGMTAVCINPYHKHSRPIMIKVDDLEE